MPAERGQISVFLVGVLVAGLLLIGLAYDGGRLFLARRDAAAVADAAALAGAGAVDESAFRATGGAVVRLDPVAAAEQARSVTGDAVAEVAVDGDVVRVRVEEVVPMLLLRFLGEQRVGASAVARPRVR
jgi:uncharacterized membrane protein